MRGIKEIRTKKFFFVAIIAFAAFVFVNFAACKKDALGGGRTDAVLIEEGAEAQIEQAPEIEETLSRALVLASRAHLYLIGRDQKMHSILTLNNGEEVELLLRSGEFDSTENGGENYLHAVHDDCDFWVRENTLAINPVQAVITANAALFSNSELTLLIPESKPLPFGTLVSLQDSESGAPINSKKSERIFFYDKNSDTVNSAYILAENVSALQDDIIVADIVNSLKVTKRESVRTQLWAKAAKYNPSKKVAAALEAQKIQKVQYDYKEVVKSLRKVGIGVNVDELMTVDQSKDPFKQ